jgi:hypothetical protein
MTITRKSALTALTLAAGLSVASPAQAAPALQTFGTAVVSGATVTIDNDAGEFGGAYLKSRSTSGKKLADVDFWFTSEGDVGGGAPRFSVPIDTDLDGTTDNGYAFIDVNSCGGATLVSTESSDCQVYFHTEPAPYANWDAFAAAHPTWRIDPGGIPFVIADVEGHYGVRDIALR